MNAQLSAQKFVRGFLEALNVDDSERVEELLISASEAKLDKEAIQKFKQLPIGPKSRNDIPKNQHFG